MRGSHTIRLFLDSEKIEITVKRKYTVIVGDSAIGKSYLFKSLIDMNEEVECDVVVNPVDTMVSFDSAISGSGQIIIVDESLGIFRDMKKYRSLLRKSDNYFIFISRLFIGHLNYSMKEIYTLEKIKNTLKLKPYYDISMKFKIADGIIITEDSKTGNEFYRQAFPNCTVYPEYGKDCGNWKVKIVYLDLYNDGILDNQNVYIIIDSSAFGAEISELISVIRNNHSNIKNIVIATPEAFEQLVCAAIISSEDDRMVNTFNYCDYSVYKSWEDYFEKLVVKLFKGYIKNKFFNGILIIKDDIIKALEELG